MFSSISNFLKYPILGGYLISKGSSSNNLSEFFKALKEDSLTLLSLPVKLFQGAKTAEKDYQECINTASLLKKSLREWKVIRSIVDLDPLADLYASSCKGYRGIAVASMLGAAFVSYKMCPYIKWVAMEGYKGFSQLYQRATTSLEEPSVDMHTLNAMFKKGLLKVQKIQYVEPKLLIECVRQNHTSLDVIESQLQEFSLERTINEEGCELLNLEVAKNLIITIY